MDQAIGGAGVIATALMIVALAILLAAVFIRRTGLYTAALERQLEALRHEIHPRLEKLEARLQSQGETQAKDALLRETRQAISDQVGAHARQVNAYSSALAQRVNDFSSTLAQRVDGFSSAISPLQDRIAGLSVEMETVAGRMAAIVSPLEGEVATLQNTVELILRRPAGALPLDSDPLQAKSDTELIAIAGSLAYLRPLVPYPRWRFDADLANPDLAFQLRRWMWEYCGARQPELSIAVPWHHGTSLQMFMGNDTSRQIYVTGTIDPNEFAFLDRFLQPGMTFLDAGANEGIYSVFAAQRVGPQGTVWAFEPSARELERLKHNLDRNRLSARVFPIALADVSGQAELSVAGDDHAGQNTLGNFAYEIELEKKDLVELRSLDQIVEANPLARVDVVKIDVEGAELRLFRGAVATLGKYRPVLLFEVSESSLRHQGASRQDLLDFLRAEGYLLHHFDRVTGLPVPSRPAEFGDNMLAVPAESPLPARTGWAWPAATTAG